MSETLAALKVRNQARLGEEKRQIERRRTLLVLILSHLSESGYHETVERLQTESGTSLSRHSVADNIDLPSILHDYEAYYEFRFGKKPKLTRRSEPSGGRSTAEKQRQLQAKRAEQRERRNRRQNYSGHLDNGAGDASDWRNSTALRGKSGASDGSGGGSVQAGGAAAAAAAAAPTKNGTAGAAVDLGVEGNKVELAAGSSAQAKAQQEVLRNAAWHQERLLKPLGAFGVDRETRDLARIISRDIYQHNPGVQWDDIVELHEAKRLLKEVGHCSGIGFGRSFARFPSLCVSSYQSDQPAGRRHAHSIPRALWRDP